MKVRIALLVAGLSLAAPALGAAPDVTARAYLVQNGTTGEVLLSFHARDRVPIASITKLMTALVALEHAGPGDVVTVSAEAASVGESSIHLREGEQLTVLDLVRATLIQSANDAATALAFYVGNGSVPRFVEMMNAKAARLGLRDTRFARPDGLDIPGHYSTARDVTRLARIAMKNAVIRRVVAERTATIPGRRLRNWNDLLGRFPGLLGVKTGHTSLAGWSQVAAARADGVIVYATLLGGPSRSARNDDLVELLAWGLSRYRRVALVVPWRPYAWARAPYGRDALKLRAPRKIVRIVRVDRPLVERVVAPTVVALPVRKGQRLGEVRIYDRRTLVARSPLIAARTIERPDLVGRMQWYAGRTVHHIWGWVT